MKKTLLFLIFILSLSCSTEVEPVPVAEFKFSDWGDGIILFHNRSENASEYYWDFGDGFNSEDENPVYSYHKPGTFRVVLTAKNKSKESKKETTITISSVK